MTASKVLAIVSAVSALGSGAAMYVIRAEAREQVSTIEKRVIVLETIAPQVKDDIKDIKADVRYIRDRIDHR